MPAYLPAVLIFVVFLAAFVLLASRWPFWLLATSLLALLVHQLAMRFLTYGLELDSGLLLGLSSWKEAALLALLIIAISSRDKRAELVNWLSQNRWITVGFVIWFSIAFVQTISSPNLIAGLAALRDYFEPFLFFPLFLVYQKDRRSMGKFVQSWIFAGLLIALLGIWQAAMWDREVYRQLGLAERHLSQAGMPAGGLPMFNGQRPPATFTGPNEFALHMVLLALFCGFWLLQSASLLVWPGFLVVVFGVAVLVTVSRSGLLALAISFAIAGWQHVQGRVATWLKTRRLIMLVVISVLLITGLWAIGIIPYLIETIQGLGREYHFLDTVDAIRFLITNPAGVGMGLVGPRQGFGFPPVAEFHVEGSLFQIAMEMGVWGLVAFLLFIGLSLHRAWNNWHAATDPLLKGLCGTAFAGWIGALAAFAFLPLMQALPLMAWLWFLLGIGFSADKLEMAWEGNPRD